MEFSKAKIVISQKGNALLEMLLFMPLGLFFLVVTVDAGLALIGKSAAGDALRAAAAAEGVIIDKVLLREDLEHWIIDRDSAEKLIDSALSFAESNVSQVTEEEDYYLYAELVVLEVSSSSGSVQHIAGSLGAASRGRLDIYSAAVLTQRRSKDNYLKAKLAASSQWAVPRLETYGDMSRDQAYYRRSVVLYLEVLIAPQGISRAAVESIRGEPFVIQIQKLQSLRRSVA